MFLYKNQIEVLKTIDPRIKAMIQKHVAQKKIWGPSNLLPIEDLPNTLEKLRLYAASLPNELKIVLFMNLLTEEGLPMFVRVLGLSLEQTLSVLSEWLALWTAEEECHGAILTRYATLTNIFNMEKLENHLFEYLKTGYNPKWAYQPFATVAYTIMQERATQVSHASVAKQVGEYDPLLQKILGTIARDEQLHYNFYLDLYKEIIKLEPNEALLVASQMWQFIEMPGASQANFKNFAQVASQLRIYSLIQYKEIVEKVIQELNIANLTNLTDIGQEAQETIMSIPQLIQTKWERLNKILRGKTFTADILFGNPQIILPGA